MEKRELGNSLYSLSLSRLTCVQGYLLLLEYLVLSVLHYVSFDSPKAFTFDSNILLNRENATIFTV